MTSETMREKSHRAPLDGLRVTALIALAAGAAGSLVLLLRASSRRQPLLTALFVIWVLSPFALLAIASMRSKHWPALTRATLHCVKLVVALASLAIYWDDSRGHRGPHPASAWVAVAPASWLLSVLAVGIAAFVSRRRSAT